MNDDEIEAQLKAWANEPANSKPDSRRLRGIGMRVGIVCLLAGTVASLALIQRRATSPASVSDGGSPKPAVIASGPPQTTMTTAMPNSVDHRPARSTPSLPIAQAAQPTDPARGELTCEEWEPVSEISTDTIGIVLQTRMSQAVAGAYVNDDQLVINITGSPGTNSPDPKVLLDIAMILDAERERSAGLESAQQQTCWRLVELSWQDMRSIERDLLDNESFSGAIGDRLRTTGWDQEALMLDVGVFELSDEDRLVEAELGPHVRLVPSDLIEVIFGPADLSDVIGSAPSADVVADS